MRGEGFDGLVDGVELDAVGGEGFGYGVEEVTKAVVVVEEEEVEAAGFGVFEHVVKGRELEFGVAQVDPAGA